MFKRRKQSSGFSWDMDTFKSLLKEAPFINFEVIYNSFYGSFSYAGQSKNIIQNFDKNPINTLFLSDIIAAFPDSKIVFLVRDPRANFLSRKEKLKSRKADIYIDPYRWKIYNKAGLKAMESHKNNFFILKYEELVLNPEVQLRKLADFFAFEYDDAMLNFHKNVLENSFKQVAGGAEQFYPQAKDKYEKLSKPVNTDRLHAWKEKLSKEEIDICSSICEIATKFGYDVAHDPPSYNLISYYKGILIAKLGIAKHKLMYKLPLSVKIRLIKPI